MAELIQKFRNQLGRKECSQLEDTWLELLETDTPVSDMLELIELVERYAPDGKGRFLLGLLAETLRDKDAYRDQLVVLRVLVAGSGNDQNLASQVADCFRRLNPGDDLVEKLLQKTGLSYGEPLKVSLRNFDLHLRLRPGTPVFDSELGAGKVENLDLLLDKVEVDFRNGASLTLPITSAHLRLRPAADEGFFRRLDTDRASLKTLAAEQPAGLIALYLRDTGERTGVDGLRTGLSEVIPESQWDAFWDHARRDLAADPHIAVHTRPTRSFQWSDSAIAKKAGRTGTSVASRTKTDETDVSSVDPDGLAALYRDATGFPQRRKLLERVECERPEDWPELFAWLFAIGRDRRARRFIEERLRQAHPDSWCRAVDKVVTGYRQNPEAFLWVLENHRRVHPEETAGLVSRAVDLLESGAHRGHWTGIRNAVADAGYALLESAFRELEEAEARHLLNRIRKAGGLEHFRRHEIVQLAAKRFPSLGESEDADYILSTARGIGQAQTELKRLLKEEMPKTADELARARSQGDLSENYEYKAAKEKQARLVARINRLRADLAHARPIEPGGIETSKVTVGCRVALSDDAGRETSYTVLGPWDSDPDNHVISYLAPFGQALLGRKTGDLVEFDGRLLTIRRIETAPVD